MSENTPGLSGKLIEILATLQRKEIKDRHYAIVQAETRVKLLRDKLDIFQVEYESLNQSIDKTQIRLDDAKEILELGKQAQQLESVVSTSPEISPAQFYRDLGVIDRGISRANAVVTDSNSILRQQIPKKLLLESCMENTRKQVEDVTIKTAEDHEWLAFAEPMAKRIDALALELEKKKEKEDRITTETQNPAEETAAKEADSKEIADSGIEEKEMTDSRIEEEKE